MFSFCVLLLCLCVEGSEDQRCLPGSPIYDGNTLRTLSLDNVSLLSLSLSSHNDYSRCKPGLYINGYILPHVCQLSCCAYHKLHKHALTLSSIRTLTDLGNGLQFGGGAGYLVLPGIAYWLRDFRKLQLATTLPQLFFLLGWRLLPESPRWLLTQGRSKEAEDVLIGGGTINKVATDLVQRQVQVLAQRLPKEQQARGSSTSLKALWQSRALRRRTAALYLTWFVSEFEYYGFSLSAGNLGGDTFVNFLTMGAVEIPAYAVSMFLLKRFGRRAPYVFIMCLGAVASLAGAAVLGPGSNQTIARIILAMIGKFSVTAALGMLYVYSSEVLPTVGPAVARLVAHTHTQS